MESSSRGILPRVLAIEDAARRVSNNGHGTADEWTTELMDAARSGPLPIHDYLNDEAEPYTSSTVKTTDVQKYFVERHGVDLLTVKAAADAAPNKGGASGESNMATDWQSRRDGFDHRRDKPTDRPINWKEWGSLPALKQWEACALSVNVNPENLKSKRMVMPGMPVFLPESFPSRAVELEFGRRLNMTSRLARGNHLAVFDPQWFAGWCLSVEWKDLPPELVAMHKPESKAAPVVRQEPTAAPVVVENVTAENARPQPLTTGDIAFCFAGLHWKTEQEWKDVLGKGRDWIEECVAVPAGGRGRGAAPKLWNPVLLAAKLIDRFGIKQNSVRARFQNAQNQRFLGPWLDAWKTYEADNFAMD